MRTHGFLVSIPTETAELWRASPAFMCSQHYTLHQLPSKVHLQKQIHHCGQEPNWDWSPVWGEPEAGLELDPKYCLVTTGTGFNQGTEGVLWWGLSHQGKPMLRADVSTSWHHWLWSMWTKKFTHEETEGRHMAVTMRQSGMQCPEIQQKAKESSPSLWQNAGSSALPI